jgi:PEP-CTERM motif
LKLIQILTVAAVLAFGVSVAHADSGGDGQPKLGGKGPGSPDCGTFQGSADSTGAINADCTVTGTMASTIIFAAPNAQTSANPNFLGLTCIAPQFLEEGWTMTNSQVTMNGVLTDECTLTAPTASTVTAQDIANSIKLSGGANSDEPDCDWDDFVFGIPVGCDITITTAGDKPNQLFAPNASFDVSPSQGQLVPFPEPSTLMLLVFGLGGLAIVQRKLARKSIAQTV